VQVTDIIRVLTSNAEHARGLVATVVPKLAERPDSCPEGCNTALDHALITAPEARDPELLRKLEALLGRVLSS
jgi:5'-methylthioadenosine phosphorylase